MLVRPGDISNRTFRRQGLHFRSERGAERRCHGGMEGEVCDGRTPGFVMRLKHGEMMVSACREFGISRKTGYKDLLSLTSNVDWKS